MSYTVIIRPPVSPKYLTVAGANGPEQRKNPGPAAVYPPTTMQLVWADLSDPYGSDPTKRMELIRDSAGTATSADIFAACPQIRDYKATRIRCEGDLRLAALATPYMERERETWHVQEREAEAWLADAGANVPMLYSIATARGITVETLVGLVMENVTLFRVVAGAILGQQQALLARVYTEIDFDTFWGLAWPTP